MFFRQIIGQEALKKQLVQSAQNGIVPHAQLFCGKAGAGAYPLALAYARYLNCSERSDTDACGKCPSCLKYNALAHPDLHFVFPIYDTKKVCDDFLPKWREFLAANTYFNMNRWLDFVNVADKQAVIYERESSRIIQKVRLKIYEAAYRVLLIWMPERMNVICANKLLKLIEEPSPNTIILMVSEEPERVLGTILSRSQRVNVAPIRADALAATIREKFSLAPEDALQIARMSHGDYLQAVNYVETSEENKFFLEQFKHIMRNAWAKNVKEMKTFANEMHGIGRERQKHFLKYAQNIIRENFMLSLQEPEINYLNKEEALFSARFAEFVNERNVFALMDELSEAEKHISQNGNAKMIFFDLALHITALLKL
ncbi:MAG: DNA polymerase III subunit delta [Tannerella sp.]|jgi:DNA polymerase-3 subunit delta'|nr:DNA polymerase III subunit delta [Tannerella sp.]